VSEAPRLPVRGSKSCSRFGPAATIHRPTQNCVAPKVLESTSYGFRSRAWGDNSRSARVAVGG
jgi:hypothetical protein